MKSHLSILLSLALLFTAVPGCQTREEVPPAPGSASSQSAQDEVIALVNGREILYSALAEQMVTVEAMYSSLAGQFSPEELQEKLHTSAITALEHLITDELLRQKVEEHNLTLTPDEESQAQKSWDEALERIAHSVRQTYPTLEGEDLDAMIQVAVEGSGLDRGHILNGARQSILVGKLKDSVLADLPVPDADRVQAAYQQLLEEQTESFRDDPTAFESQAISGGPLVYVPEEYRVLQEVYLHFDDDVIQLLNELKQYDTEDNDTYEEMLEAEYRRLEQEKLPQLRRRLSEGVPFSQLMEEVKPGSSDTYNYISSGTTRVSADYFQAAMAISSPGQASAGEIRMPYGYVVLFWCGTLDPGVRPLAEVNEALVLQLAQQDSRDAWNEIQTQWRQEADVVIHEDRLGY